MASWRDNLRSSFVDQGSFVGSLGVAHTLGNRDVISLAAQAQEFLLDGNGYRTSLGAVARYTMRLSDNSALSFSGDVFRLNYDNNPLADANRYGASITYAGREIFAGIGQGGKRRYAPPSTISATASSVRRPGASFRSRRSCR